MGLGIAGAVYLLVTIIAGMAVPADTLAESDGPLLEVVTQGPLARQLARCSPRSPCSRSSTAAC